MRTVSMVKIPSKKNLKITVGENMKVKNTSEGTLGFIDDDGKRHDIKAGEVVECNYKDPTDPRLIIESKKKKGDTNGSN